MSDVRALLSAALHDNGLHSEDAAEVADALLARSDLAVVALPSESWPSLHGRSFGTDVHTYKDRVLVGTDLDLNADYSRALAAALLVAANAADKGGLDE